MTDVILAILLGGTIGLSLGALGGGGSILTVPALVYVLGVSAKHSTSASLLIVGLSALLGMVAHGRAGRVRWTTGLLVGVISVGGSLVGTALNRKIDPNLLLLVFAALMFVVAFAMIRRDRSNRVIDTNAGALVLESADFPTRIPSSTSASLPVDRVVRESVAKRSRPSLVMAVGLCVGFLTGFLGVGGGFIVVPSLVLALGFELDEAVGTSLLIIAISSAFAIVERGGVDGVAPHILVPFAGGAMAAALLGNEIANRVPVQRLTRGFIGLIVMVACYVAVRSGVALA